MSDATVVLRVKCNTVLLIDRLLRSGDFPDNAPRHAAIHAAVVEALRNRKLPIAIEPRSSSPRQVANTVADMRDLQPD